MHVRNNEFRRILNTKFKDHDVLKQHISQIKLRPELGPHYIYNVQSNYELGPGPGRETQAARRETLKIMSNINFQQLGQTTSQVQLPQRASSADDSSLNRSQSSINSSIRFSFREELMHLKLSEREKCRNLTPLVYHKNVSLLGNWIDQSNAFWTSGKNTGLERENVQRLVPNVIRKNRLLCTK